MKLNEIKIGKLNVLDLSIILVIVLFIGVFVFDRVTANEDDSSIKTNQMTTFTYTISIEGLSETSTDMFRVGDEVYDKVSNVYIGKIKELEITEASGLIDKDNGDIIKTTVPGKIDVKLGIETNGMIKDGEYLANDLIRIMVGNTKQIKTKYVMCMGTITAIER